jgi:hypothetical protein
MNFKNAMLMNQPTLQSRPSVRLSAINRTSGARNRVLGMRHAVWLLALTALLPSPVGAAQYTEPDVIVFGRVINVFGGSAHQIFQGRLQLTFTFAGNSQPVIWYTELRQVGPSGEYSYRTSIPLAFLPATNELSFTLSASSVPKAANPIAKLDGTPLRLADPVQAKAISIGSGVRGQEFQLDLSVSRSELDSDGDGIPDWWAELYGLNKFSANNAAQDLDGDGLSNLREFQLGTDPRVANTTARVLNTQFYVPVGGQAGLALNLVNQGSSPTNVHLSFSNTTAGLTWQRRGTNLAAGTEFTHQALLDGEISVKATRNFTTGSAQLLIRDTTPAKTQGPVQFTLRLEGFSPGRGIGSGPAVWLDAAMAPPEGEALAEWMDSSGSQRDCYQPVTAAQPLSHQGAVRFEAGRFLYLDDRSLNAPEFTAFLCLDMDGVGPDSQTVLRTANLQLDVQRNATRGTSYLKASQFGRSTIAPLASPGANVYVLTAGAASTQLESADQGVTLSVANSTKLRPAYPTVGALFPLTASAASNTLQGSFRELVLFAAPLPSTSRAELQDYQLSRWNGFLVWNYTRSTLAHSIVGPNEARNILNGGLGDDVLRGGQQADILRGGEGWNTLTGGHGPDRFVFSRTSSHDAITDFNAGEGDVVDLADLMDVPSGGTIPNVVVGQVVTRGTNNFPRVDTLIEIRFDGPDAPVNQTITLQNVGDLPPFALRVPAAGVVPVPPSFVSVEPAGTVSGDFQGMAAVPNLVEGSMAIDQAGAPVPIFQVPPPGTFLTAGDHLITLTARDNNWNTIVTNSLLKVTVNRNLLWGGGTSGMELTVPAGAVLESALDITGPWEVVPGAGKVIIPTDRAWRFLRLRSN